MFLGFISFHMKRFHQLRHGISRPLLRHESDLPPVQSHLFAMRTNFHSLFILMTGGWLLVCLAIWMASA